MCGSSMYHADITGPEPASSPPYGACSMHIQTVQRLSALHFRIWRPHFAGSMKHPPCVALVYVVIARVPIARVAIARVPIAHVAIASVAIARAQAKYRG
jgi:hypothetical protein